MLLGSVFYIFKILTDNYCTLNHLVIAVSFSLSLFRFDCNFVIYYCSSFSEFCLSFSRYKTLTVFYYHQNAFENLLVKIM